MSNLHGICGLCGRLRPAMLVFEMFIVSCECVPERTGMICIKGSTQSCIGLLIHIDHDPGDEHP